MKVFWLYGYEATSVRLLEKEMGINQFSIYSSFQNKKNLFINAIRSYREYMKNHHFQLLLQENAGFQELERFFLEAVNVNLTERRSKGCLIVNTAGELGDKDSDIAREINQYYDFIREMIKNVLRNAVRKQEIPVITDVEQQANFFLGVMQSLSVASKTMENKQLNDFISLALKQLK